jgi:hypothetical protein
VDIENNLYVGVSYNSMVVKIPYVNGTYAALAATTSTTPNCKGATDTVECIMSNVTISGGSGVVSMVFDSKGDLFFGTTNNNQGGSNPNSIYECTAACLYSGSPAATLLFKEPTSATPNTTGQLSIGGMAIDASGNLFFTDSAMGATSNQESFTSNVNELPYTRREPAMRSAPTVIYTYTPATPANYDAEIDGVATSPNGTVYALLQNTAGILAFPNVSGVYSNKTMYLVSTQSGKLLTSDGLGNLYEADNGGNIYRIEVNNLVATTTPNGTPSTATNVTTFLNDGSCSPAPTVAFAATGTSAAAFSAATTGTCTATLTGGAFATTLTFTPTAVGTSSATLTATDSLRNNGTAAVIGMATGTVATPTFSVAAGTYTSVQSVTISDSTVGASIYYTTNGSTPSASSTLYSGPVTVGASETISAIGVDTGDTSSAVATAAYVINLPGIASPPTFSVAAGTYTSPQTVTLSDTTTGAAIYYTTDGSTPTVSSNLYVGPIAVSKTETVNAIAIATGFSNSSVATAAYTINLSASAFQNAVMTQSTSLGALPSSGGAQSGGEPAGDTMAVNSAGNLIATNTYGNDVSLFTPQGGTPTLLGTISNPNGVAVDIENNLYVGVSYNSMVVKIPYVNGTYAALAATTSTTPNCKGATDTVECIMSNVTISGGSGVVSMVFDSKGDLFFGTTNNNQGGSNPNSIYECTAACLYSGTPAAKLLFTEPTSATPNTTGQLSIGGMAIDASGNLFFTDSAMGATSNQESFTSNLNELPYTSGTGYAAAPTVIYTYTPATPANYDAEIDGVATSPNGTVYALLQNTAGILAFPNVSGVYSNKTMYLVSTQSGKLLTSDGLGNLYEADNGGNIYKIAVDTLIVPTAPVGNPSTATNVTTFLNDGSCSPAPTVAFAATGTSAAAFSAATTGTCTTTLTGGAFATTLTFTPISVGTNSAALTATDSLKNNGTAAISGVGTPAPPAGSPTFSVGAGTYTTVQAVTISDATTGAAIYYTTNGSTPTTSSTLYSGPITVGASETITAIATATGYAPSPVASVVYVINLPPAATPTFSVAAGTYTTPQTVTISDATTGATIYYTTNGSAPTTSSTKYTGPITVGVTETINAIATPSSVAINFVNSAVASAIYTINLPTAATPTFSITAGTYVTVQTVSLSDATTGATIYYTTNGSTPTTSSTVYAGSITVGVSETIKAIAVDTPNYNNSVVASVAYVINLPPPAFTITSPEPTITVPAGGSGSIILTITANAAFNGSIAFNCSGFLPVGATCAFTPPTVTTLALASATTTLTITVPSATTADLHRGPSPLFAGTMLAVVLWLGGFRKRCRLQLLLLLALSAIGTSIFTGCATTSSSKSTSSQIVVTATSSTSVTETLPLVLTIQ